MTSDRMDLPGLTPDAARNRAMWDAFSDEYQATHADQLAQSGGLAWGTAQVPESELQVLGDLAGKDILELGCGAAQWSIALARAGARPVGLDLSTRQLEHARRLMSEAGVDFPLVNASAEAVPLADRRSGGLFAFNHHSPIETICWPLDAVKAGDRLVFDYFGLHRIDDGEDVSYQLPYGEWIRLFRANCLVVEDLVEPCPLPGATSTYRDAEQLAWGRGWPAECIWRLRRM